MSDEEHIQQFIENYEIDDVNPSESQIDDMSASATNLFYLDYSHLYDYNSKFAFDIYDNVEKILECLSSVVLMKLKTRNPVYAEQITHVNCSLIHLLDTLPIYSLTSKENYKLIQLEGIVIQRSGISSRPRTLVYRCPSCRDIIQIEQTEQWRITPDKCLSCDNRKGFTPVYEETVFDDYQWIELRELNENTPSGKSPEKVKVLLRNHHANSCEVGEEVTLTGIRKVLEKSPNSATLELKTYIDCIGVVNDTCKINESITQEDIEKYKKWVQEEDWIPNLIKSVVPVLKGLDEIKLFLALQQVGGVPKQIGENRKRGSIHGELAGDPSEGKSECLSWAKRVSPRGVYVAGGGASGVGLTASAKFNKDTGDWELQAGAFVLADNGHVSVDEIEKMRDEDRDHIHPAMAQQKIPVNKAGINAELLTRCSVLGASNPKIGKWDKNATIENNISNLPHALLTRFDCIFILINDRSAEEELERANYVLELHKNHSIEGAIPESELKKFFTYAKTLEPTLTDEVNARLLEIYGTLFKAGQAQDEKTVMITLRLLEGLIRLTEASAKLHLREETTLEDAELAIRVLTASLLQSALNPETGNIDVSQYYSEKKSKKDMVREAPKLLAKLLKSNIDHSKVNRTEYVSYASQRWHVTVGDVRDILDMLIKDGTFYCPTPYTVAMPSTLLNITEDNEEDDTDE